MALMIIFPLQYQKGKQRCNDGMGPSDLDRMAAIGEPTMGKLEIQAGMSGYWRSRFAIGCVPREGWAIRSTEGGPFQMAGPPFRYGGSSVPPPQLSNIWCRQ